MSMHSLNWPGLEKLPVCVIDPISGNVYTSSEPVPVCDRARLDRIEFKYVRASVVLDQFSCAGRPRALDTLAYLAAAFGQQGDSALTQDSDFVHVNTLLTLIVVYPWCSSFQKARGAILRFLLFFRESPCWLCGFVRRDCICDGGTGVDVAGTMPMRQAKLPVCCDSSMQTDAQVVCGGTMGVGVPGVTVLLPPGGIQLQPGMRIPLTGGLPGLPGNAMSIGGIQPSLPPPLFFPPPPAPPQLVTPTSMFHNGLTQPIWPPFPQAEQSMTQALSDKPWENMFSKPIASAVPSTAITSTFPIGVSHSLPPYSSPWNARPPYAPAWSSVLRLPMQFSESSAAAAAAGPIAPRMPYPPVFRPDPRLTKTQSTQTPPLSMGTEKKCKRPSTSVQLTDSKTPPSAVEGVETKKPKIDTHNAVVSGVLQVTPLLAKPMPVPVIPVVKTLEVNAKSLRDRCLWRLIDDDSDDSKSDNSANDSNDTKDGVQKAATDKVSATPDRVSNVKVASSTDETELVGIGQLDKVKTNDDTDGSSANTNTGDVIEADCAAILHDVMDKVDKILHCDAPGSITTEKVAEVTNTKHAEMDVDSVQIDTGQPNTTNNMKGGLLIPNGNGPQCKDMLGNRTISEDEEKPLVIDTTVQGGVTTTGDADLHVGETTSPDKMSCVANDEKEVAEILSSMSYVTSPQKDLVTCDMLDAQDVAMEQLNHPLEDIASYVAAAPEAVSALQEYCKNRLPNEDPNKIVDLTAEDDENVTSKSVEMPAIVKDEPKVEVNGDGTVDSSKPEILIDVESKADDVKLAAEDTLMKEVTSTENLAAKAEQEITKDETKAVAVTCDKKSKVKKKADKSSSLEGVPVASACLVAKSEQCYRRYEFLPTGERLYRCLHAGAAGHCFDSRIAADWHSRSHLPGKGGQNCNTHLFCHLCDYNVQTPRWYTLLRHLRVTHTLVMTNAARCCHLCGLSFSSDMALTTHEDYHYNSRYKCIYCGRTLATWRQVLRHLEDDCALQAVAGLRHLGCPYCPLVFHKRSMRSVHALSHTDAGLACAFCSAEHNDEAAGGDGTWDVWRRLRRHYQQKHSRRMQAELSALGSAPAKRERPRCHVCNTDFRLLDDYRRHMLTTHDFVPRVCVECEECGKVFRNERTRDRHARSVHSVNMKCDKCHFIAKSALILKLHDKTEHIERPHVCTECDKTFVSYRELKSHLVRHATHSIHVCKICDQEFGSVKNLNRHRQTDHADEGRKQSGHACPECSYTCYSRVNLREHMKSNHPDDEDDDNALVANRAKGPDHSYSNETVVKKARLPIVSAPPSARKKRPTPQKKSGRMKRSKAKIAAVTATLPRRGRRKKMQSVKLRPLVEEQVKPRMKRYACARLRTIENCRTLKQLHPPQTDTTFCHDSPSNSMLHSRSRFMTSIELDHSYCRVEVDAPQITPTVHRLMSPGGSAIVSTPRVGDYEECSTALLKASPPGDGVCHENVVEGASRLIALLRQQMEAGGGDNVPDAMQVLRQVTGSVMDTTDDEMANSSSDNIEQQLADFLMSIQNEESGNVATSTPTSTPTSSKTDTPLLNSDTILGRPGILPMDLDDIELDEADYRLWDDAHGIPMSVTPDGKRHAAAGDSATKATSVVTSITSPSVSKRENSFLARINSADIDKCKSSAQLEKAGVTAAVGNTNVGLPTSSGVTVITLNSSDNNSLNQVTSASSTHQSAVSSVVGELLNSPVKLMTSLRATGQTPVAKPLVMELLRTSPIRPLTNDVKISANILKTVQSPGAVPMAIDVHKPQLSPTTSTEIQHFADVPKVVEPHRIHGVKVVTAVEVHRSPVSLIKPAAMEIQMSASRETVVEKPQVHEMPDVTPIACELKTAKVSFVDSPRSEPSSTQIAGSKPATTDSSMTTVVSSAIESSVDTSGAPAAIGMADTTVAKTTTQPLVSVLTNDSNRSRSVVTVMAPPGMDFTESEMLETPPTIINVTHVTEKHPQARH